MIENIPVDKLQKILDEAVASGEECGLELAIWHRGKPAANLCAGYADAAHTRPVTTDTLFPLFSSGKAVMATAFHMLKEEYGFDYAEKVSRYWPGFTGHGKEDIEIRHVLSHRTGLHFLPNVPDTSPLLADWDHMVERMENAVPKWTPGTKCGYQGITFAWLLGELAFRISGVPFREYTREKILIPLGVDQSFFFGIPEECDRGTAEIDDGAFGGSPCWTKNFISQPALRRGFIPSANGIGTAMAAATVFNALYHAPLLKNETIENATQLLRHPDDPLPASGAWEKFGLGYVLPCWETRGGDIFGHGGAAGAELFYCKSEDLALCFAKNRILPSHPVHPVRNRISEALGLPIRFW